MRARARALDPVARAALAEAICGNMGIHIAYLTRAADPVQARPWQEDATVPVLRELDGPALARALRPDGVLPVTFDGLRVAVPLPRLAAALLARIDGRANWGEILDGVVAGGASRDQALRDRDALVQAMERMNRLLIAAPA